MTDEIDDALVAKALNAYHGTNAWRIAPGDEPAKMRAAIRAAILADRAECARIIRAHLCVPWRIDGTRDDEAAAAGNEIIERLAQAILARGERQDV